MRSVEIVMRNPSGLHARPATLFTEAAAGFAAKVTVENLTRGKGPVDAKSMLMLLTAGVSKDHRVRLVADGPDEDAAIDSLVGLVESGLGEPGAWSVMADSQCRSINCRNSSNSGEESCGPGEASG